MKFQLNQMKTEISLKLFDTPVTLEYGHGHWKSYKQVKHYENCLQRLREQKQSFCHAR